MKEDDISRIAGKLMESAGSEDKAYKMLTDSQWVANSIADKLRNFSDELVSVKKQIEGLENFAGQDRAILEARKTYLPSVLKFAKILQKYVNDVVKEMEKAK